MEYVFAVTDGMVLNNVQGGTVTLRRNDAWFADDPFVSAKPDLFSASPVIVHSTVGRLSPPPTSVTPPVAAILASGFTSEEAVAAVRRGGRGRRA